nr:PREDICTED: fetuin-B-like isoform X2 [Latimeria chalumnae]|eukprot:XP_014340183.1 PREDICTED: fetuin-B-like isoform X2 [Latimeria chalumnae]
MMQLFFLLVCVQLLSCLAQLPGLHPAPCNSKKVEKAARLSIGYINEERMEGYKYSLNRINKAYVDYQKVSGTCEVTMSVTPQAQAVMYKYSCNLAPDKQEEVTDVCPDCPLLIDPDGSEAAYAVNVSLNKYNAESNQSNYFAVAGITRASRQEYLDQAYFVEFPIYETSCLKKEVILSGCNYKPLENAHNGFCTAEVSMNEANDPAVEVACEIYTPKVQENENNNHKNSLQTSTGPSDNPDIKHGTRENPIVVKEGKQDQKANLGYVPVTQSPQKNYVLVSKRYYDDSSESDSSEEMYLSILKLSRKIPRQLAHRRTRTLPYNAPDPPEQKLVFLHTFPNMPPHSLTCPGSAMHIIL